jgi:uncharacterized protein YndB with AHSA1/START domain
MQNEKSNKYKGRKIETAVEFNASVDAVWNAWSKPEEIERWFADRVSGETIAGGTLTLHWDGFDFDAPLQVLEAVPKLRTITSAQKPGGRLFITEVTLEQLSGDRTLLMLVESGFEETSTWDDEYEGRNSGWKVALQIMKHYLEHYPGQNRKGFLATRNAHFEHFKLRPFFRESEKLSKWLTKSGSLGEEGASYSLELKEGGRMAGTIIAVTDCDVALTWPEVKGLVTLKSIGACCSDHQALAVTFSGWDITASRFKEVEAIMKKSLDRLHKEIAMV